MGRKRKTDGGGASWLETYSDMVTLLLTFFIMLYAMSTIDAQKYAIIVEAFSKGNQVKETEEDLSGTGKMDGGTVEIEEADEENIDQLYAMLKSYVDENNLSESVELSKSEEYVFIRFSDEITFKGYSNTLNQSGKEILDVLAIGLELVDEYIEEVIIAGHTAAVENDKSNIDRALSTDRANAVLQYLEGKGVISPAKYLAIGYGLYSPIADNSTTEGRAKNRRVEIYISRKGYPISYTKIISNTLNGIDDVENMDNAENLQHPKN
ncbi:MAG: flagellar motor protein MotB [Sedimentibacter sp.]|uniref:OmpA/MotB family protein n=1 Tax=Sedimentibacter sp. TaxID=1960295 RepID=UPI0029828B10|nr:flagellar motor protein MotB [Sedimentibacter sp.]MDW5300374.1 flagellar motor protein MotB [Sedimentibacter sp.]